MKRFNQKGIGLVQVLLASAILGGLALVIARFSNDATKVTANVETNNDIVSSLQQMQAILSDPESCTTTFAGKRANNNPSAAGAIRLRHNGLWSNVFETKSINPNISYGQQQLKINSYALSDADDDVDVTTLSTTHLLVDFDRGTKGAQTQSIVKKINLRVVVNASGDIISCTAFSTGGSELWKYTSNNTDIFYSGGNVAVGTTAPTSNLTVRAVTMPGISPGIAIIGNEAMTAGSNRSNLAFYDQSSTHAWSVSMFGTASSEGEGKFGINGGPKVNPLLNKFIITKEGDVGLGTTAPYKGFTCIPSMVCPNSIDFQVHNNSTDPLIGGANLVLSSNAITNGSIVGALAFGTMGSINSEKRVAVVTGQIENNSPLRGNLLFWTTNGGVLDRGMSLGPTGDLYTKREITTTTLNVPSDRRLKKDIFHLKESLNKVTAIEPVTYYWKDLYKPRPQIGFIAQQVEKVFPELVKTDEHGIKALAYMDLIAPVVNAIKELNQKLTSHQKEVDDLKKDTQFMRKYLCNKDPSAEFCLEGDL